MKQRHLINGLAALLLTSNVMAEGVSIQPGQWEMTSTMTMTMMPQPRTQTSTECITESELGPEDFNMDKNSPCDITNLVVDGNTISWDINCPIEGAPPTQGHWQFTSSGDEITGNGSMTAELGGQAMDFKMDWAGKRIGDCG